MHLKQFIKAPVSLVFCLILSFPAISQSENQPEAKSKTPKNVIKIAPFAWLHGQLPFTVESKIGYERAIGERSSLMGSYSYLGSNPAFGFIGSVALSATLTTALNLYGKPGKAEIVWTKTKIQTSGYRYQLQYKHYLNKKAIAPEGLYLSPHYSFTEANYNVEMTDLDVKVGLKTKNRNYNVLFGYQAILGKHFVLDIFTGLGIKKKSTEIFDANGTYLGEMPKSSPVKLSSGFNIGWAF